MMDLEERKIAIDEKWLELRKEMFSTEHQESKRSPDDAKSKTFTPVFATVLVAIIGFLGTAIATIINNYNQNLLEQRKFESDLIKKSLEEQSQDNKIKSLKLLTTLHLIKDEDVKLALDKFLIDTVSAKKELPINLPADSGSIAIVGRSFTPADFAEYLGRLDFTAWKPVLIVLHSTGTPNLTSWHQTTGELRMKGLGKFYGSMGWGGGAHLFIADDSIWVLNPLTKPGVHSPTWNKISIGIEMIGDYSSEPFDPRVRDNSVKAISALCKVLQIDPESLKFHFEDPMTTKKNCPGKNVDKNDIIMRVKQQMQR
jgi:hypothetical protein